MERVLLFDGHCPACSSLARAVDELQLPGLTARSLHDPEVAARLDRAGLAVPAKPALLWDDGKQVRLLTGVRLRVHLVRLLGFRRGRAIARLAAMEARARVQRVAGEGSVPRRRVFRGMLGLAAGAAGASILGAAQPAAANPAARLSTSAADPQLVADLLADSRVQQAVAAFGPAPAAAALEVHGAQEPIIALVHDDGVMTYIGLAPGQQRVVLSMRPLGGERGVEFLTPTGESLGTVTSHNGRVEVAAPADAQPQSFTTCFITCVGFEVATDCVDSCTCCVDCPWPAYILACGICTACTAGKGILCARRCLGV